MEKILPMVIPPVETYQNTSFVMGMILANARMQSVKYNYYNNIVCNKTNYMKKIELCFADSTWDTLVDDGLAEMNLYHLSSISKDKFILFVKERIDQDNYLLIYQIDEYYLSYSRRYQKEHYLHDTYIFGYTDEAFCVMAQKNGKLQMLEINCQEIMDGLYSLLEEYPDANFCSFRFRNVTSSINEEKILADLKNFVVGETDEEKNAVYGRGVYKIINDCTIARACGKKEEGDLFDLRIFRMMWEHKKILTMQFERINSLHPDWIVDILDQQREVEHLANKIFYLAKKFTVTKRNELLFKISENIQKLEKEETECIEELLERFNIREREMNRNE